MQLKQIPLNNYKSKIGVMNDIIREDILKCLSRLKEIFLIPEEKDIPEIKELSDHTIHNSSIFQDEDSISVAILIYSLSKILERNPGIQYKPFLDKLTQALEYLESKDTEGYRHSIKGLFKIIHALDSKVKMYIEELITQSQVRKAGKIYAHGISVGRASEILGISQWELLSYIGKTTYSELPEEIVNVRERLKLARRLFL